MRIAIAALTVAVLGATPAAAGQGWGRARSQDRTARIPPGHLPPPGECRVWYDGRPPGHQPPPTDCRQAERIASRDRDARVVYGGSADRDEQYDRRPDSNTRSSGGWLPDVRSGDDSRGGWGRAVPRRGPGSAPSGTPYPQSRLPRTDQRTNQDVAFDAGYREGLSRGREDVRLGRGPDATRHSEYRAATRGYDSRSASRADYQEAFRHGFRTGYREGYGSLSSPDQRPRGWRRR